jgi:hypothetical protein
VADVPTYVGHYLGHPRLWFVTIAPNRREALLRVDAASGEPDPRSLRQVRGEAGEAIVLDFHVDGKDDHIDYRGGDVIFEAGVTGWINRRAVREPSKVEEPGSAAAARFGVTSAEIWGLYAAPEEAAEAPK